MGSDIFIFKAVQSFYLFLGIIGLKKNCDIEIQSIYQVTGFLRNALIFFTKFLVNHKKLTNLAENTFES